MIPPPEILCCCFLFCHAFFKRLLLLPYGKFSLPFFTFIISENGGHETASDCFNFELGYIGIVDNFFAATQIYLRILFSRYNAFV
jgi:hypothetical protein